VLIWVTSAGWQVEIVTRHTPQQPATHALAACTPLTTLLVLPMTQTDTHLQPVTWITPLFYVAGHLQRKHAICSSDM
jgi:hypothetical protein